MATYHVELLNRRGSPGAIRWREWGAPALGEARSAGKTILLFLTARWSTGCAVMEARVFADAAVTDLIHRDWIPVRVDADRRPDLDARYNLGGWPTTAFLTPDGEILYGGTYFEPRELADALVRAREAFLNGVAAGLRRDPVGPVAGVSPAAGEVVIDPDAADRVTGHLMSVADAVHGGFGSGPKSLSVDALTLLLDRSRGRADSAEAHVVTGTLDAICAALYDHETGGFCRGAARRDWQDVRREKRIADNAAIVPLLIDAASVLDRPLYYDRALETMAWCRSSMTDPEHGGFFSSVRPSGPGEDAGSIGDDIVDRTMFADANAAMASACLKVGDACADTALVELGVLALERVALTLYRPGAGVSHYQSRGGGSMAFLQDQVRMAAALITAAQLTGRVPYVMLAEELMQFSRRTLWDEASGGFFDRKAPEAAEGDVGPAGERVKPFDVNCEAARALAALAMVSEQEQYLESARQALASQTPFYRGHGLVGAAYALAALDLQSASASLRDQRS